MLAELFAHLSAFAPLPNYRYIGFGSYYFSDFSLFHRQLGFKEMVNIEQDGTNRKRYEFNSPYGGIKHIFKKANAALNDIKIASHRNILWLDYLCHLNGECLQDVETFCRSTPSGSMILVSVNGRIDLSESGIEQAFRASISEEYFTRPAASLSGDGFHAECISILKRKIDRVLLDRKAASGEGFHFRPLINIAYSDGVRMITYGGLIYSDSDAATASSIDFSALGFVREDTSFVSIECPVLTFKEIRHIDAILGSQSAESTLAKIPIPRTEWTKYKDLYRYYPNYTHADFC